MAGALSLQEDIEALVEKHKDVALPVDLLSRLAEDARLMAVKANIRSLHEADPFRLFTEDTESLEDSDEEMGGGKRGRGSGASKAGKEAMAGADVKERGLPSFVERMLGMMKITRHDEVKALNGFTTIEADVEFIPAPPADTRSPEGMPCPSWMKAAKKLKKKEKARAANANGGAPAKASPAKPEPKPVQLHFRFLREARGHGSGGGMFPPGVIDGSDSSSDEEDDEEDDDETDDSDNRDVSPGGVHIEVLDDEEDGSEREQGARAADEPTKARDKVSGGRKIAGDGGKGNCAKTTQAKSKQGPEGNAATGVKSNGHAGQAAARSTRKGLGQRKRVCSADGDGYRDVEGSRDDGARRKRSKGSPHGPGDSGLERRGFARGNDDKQEEDDDDDDDDGDETESWPEMVLGDDRAFFTRVSESDEDEDEEDELDFDPQTVVSYTITGGIDYDEPELLLHALVYAREDGPAFSAPRKGRLNRDGSLDSDAEDAEDYSDDNDDEVDAFDAFVDHLALSKIGECLGLHTPHHESSRSEDEADEDLCMNGGRGERGPNIAKRGSGGGQGTGAEGEGEGAGVDKMTLEDLVWWLMMFPFFEKEFDIVGVVMSSIFGDGDSDDEEDSEDEDDEDDESDDGQGGGMGNWLLVGRGTDDDGDSEDSSDGDGDGVRRSGVSIEELD